MMHELLSPLLRVLYRATVIALIGGVYGPSAAPLLGVTALIGWCLVPTSSELVSRVWVGR